jgi:3-methylfumaryl-CoA hydratase
MNQEADPKAWIGRQETIDEVATLPTIVRLGATLAQPVLQGDVSELPPLSHWLYFLPATSTVDLKSDGHPKMGVFLPPITLPRRMWAGSRVAFHTPIRIGDAMTRHSTIADVTQKEGKSGSLVFITVKHEVLVDGTAAIVEEQDLVYREAATAGASAVKSDPSPHEAQWRKRIDPSPMLLFRFSALTFNSHRIHYDKPYAQEEEGYPDLVVHGPL